MVLMLLLRFIARFTVIFLCAASSMPFSPYCRFSRPWKECGGLQRFYGKHRGEKSGNNLLVQRQVSAYHALSFNLKTKFIFLSYSYNHHLLERKTNQRYAARPSNVRISHEGACSFLGSPSGCPGNRKGYPYGRTPGPTWWLPSTGLCGNCPECQPDGNSDLLAQYSGLESILSDVLYKNESPADKLKLMANNRINTIFSARNFHDEK